MFSVVHLRRVVFRLWRRPCACLPQTELCRRHSRARKKEKKKTKNKKENKIPMKLEYYREKIAARQSITAP